MILTPKKRSEIIKKFSSLSEEKKWDFIRSFDAMSILSNCLEQQWFEFANTIKAPDPTINRKISSIRTDVNDVKRYLYSLFTPKDKDLVEIDKPASVLEFLRFYMVLPADRLNQINSALHRELQKIPELKDVVRQLEKHWVVVFPDGYADVYTISKSKEEAIKRYEENSGAKWSEAKSEGFKVVQVEISFFAEK